MRLIYLTVNPTPALSPISQLDTHRHETAVPEGEEKGLSLLSTDNAKQTPGVSKVGSQQGLVWALLEGDERWLPEGRMRASGAPRHRCGWGALCKGDATGNPTHLHEM